MNSRPGPPYSTVLHTLVFSLVSAWVFSVWDARVAEMFSTHEMFSVFWTLLLPTPPPLPSLPQPENVVLALKVKPPSSDGFVSLCLKQHSCQNSVLCCPSGEYEASCFFVFCCLLSCSLFILIILEQMATYLCPFQFDLQT